MPINILMPALSPTMEKGNLAKWLKKEGDKVKSGDVIAEIETDKATMEVEAVDEGTIAKILVPEGTQDVPVNDVIAVLAGDGEDVKSAGAVSGRKTERSACEGGSPHRRQSRHRRRRQLPRQPLHRPQPQRLRRHHQRRRPMVMRALSHRHWRGVWPRTPASTSPASPGRARMAVSSPAMWQRRSPARD